MNIDSNSKLKINKVIIVEGKYDKIKLNSFIDGLIIQTDGFRIFKDKEKKALIKALALKRGIIIATDSDVAGFKLRNYIMNIANGCDIRNLYIPQIQGKEKRKEKQSKENLLGVEGIDCDMLKKLFIEADKGASILTTDNENQITKMDFYDDGLIGKSNSSEKRLMLLKKLNLPSYINTNSLLKIINSLISYEEYKKIIDE